MASITLLSYADKNFRVQQHFCCLSARLIGGFDAILKLGPDDIDPLFKEKNSSILSNKKGGGYWLWKPYLIRKALGSVLENEYVFYADSGCFFIKNPRRYFEDKCCGLMQDIVAFELPLIEKQWTKKQVFKNLGCDTAFFHESNQIQGGFILARNTQYAREFFDELISLAEEEVNITDSNSLEGQIDQFIEHRHDQSLFSLLYKKKGMIPLPDITQFGRSPTLYLPRKWRALNYRLGKTYICSNILFRVNLIPATRDYCIYLSRSYSPFLAIASLLLYRLKTLVGSLGRDLLTQ